MVGPPGRKHCSSRKLPQQALIKLEACPVEVFQNHRAWWIVSDFTLYWDALPQVLSGSCRAETSRATVGHLVSSHLIWGHIVSSLPELLPYNSRPGARLWQHAWLEEELAFALKVLSSSYEPRARHCRSAWMLQVQMRAPQTLAGARCGPGHGPGPGCGPCVPGQVQASLLAQSESESHDCSQAAHARLLLAGLLVLVVRLPAVCHAARRIFLAGRAVVSGAGFQRRACWGFFRFMMTQVCDGTGCCRFVGVAGGVMEVSTWPVSCAILCHAGCLC